MRQGVFIDAMDILDKYIKIAFADITDFITYGRKEVPLIGAFGPIKDEDGNALNHEINYIDFKESSMVDGTIISEVKQGKDGISVKLADKMKALEKLSLYFDLFPDKFKRDLEEEKLKIAHHKVFGANGEEEYESDGFVEALNGKVKRYGVMKMSMKLKPAPFKFKPFSKKQLKVLTWWKPTSPHKDKDLSVMTRLFFHLLLQRKKCNKQFNRKGIKTCHKSRNSSLSCRNVYLVENEEEFIYGISYRHRIKKIS
jgi:hypothetical protein